MEYLSIQDVSNKWDISKRRIQVLCREGRINGAKMIGNMWVIPENSERPNDARTRNPVVEKKSYSAVRSDLKKILKIMYKRCDDVNILEEDKKSYVLSIIAGSLCFLYIHNISSEYKVFEYIYKNISGNKLLYSIDEEMILVAKEYIQKHKNDSEIESIISWAYQYSNKIMTSSDYSQTQFFTEKYMIRYLVRNIDSIKEADKILDPCVGGGNFLVECLELRCEGISEHNIESKVIELSKKLYGYDIDAAIARIAVVNIRIKALAILNKCGKKISFNVWNQISPNVFCSIEKDTSVGSLAKDNRMVRNVLTGECMQQDNALGNANIVVTNPPFASIKGMHPEQKKFLKEYYPLSKCDTCVAFMDAIGEMLSPDGLCGIVTQNAWMYLKSFDEARDKFVSNYSFYNIVNLGSGAFIDLSGEKSNVSLLIFGKDKLKKRDNIIVQNLSRDSLSKKMEKVENGKESFSINQNKLNGANGFVLSEYNMPELENVSEKMYSRVAVPMQGTSTGNSKELVGYFWKHFGDRDWIPVSNGGGYCRWEGLNHCVVKWGNDGEYIKAQKGSALRNVKYFDETQLVFSDTGTAGLNVRALLKNQIFIASGPGIRILSGNKYAHMAFLNSRFAANYVRTISPKLTIAAGYIGRIPIKDSLFTSAILERNAKLCVELKCNHLKFRPNNLEYKNCDMAGLNIDDMAWELLKNDLTNELLKLEIECQCDDFILQEYGFSGREKAALREQAGECAFDIKSMQTIDIFKLDKYIAKLLDDACMLKRSRTSKISLGCDGVLEFTSKDLNINPASIVEQICIEPWKMKTTLVKYKDMIIHNRILDLLKYSVNTGIEAEVIDTNGVVEEMNRSVYGCVDIEEWMVKKFNSIHTGIFKGRPFLIFEDGEIKKYD